MRNPQGRVEDIVANCNNYIEGYISTDAMEIEEALLNFGYALNGYDDRVANLLPQSEKLNSYSFSVVDEKTNISIICSDIDYGEEESTKETAGFEVMSRIRIYPGKMKNITGILITLLKALDKEKQNVTFISDQRERYTRFSEFYM
ncbi:hypothetical protein COV17_01645 [Candidatus Woesearchaeota archaeon CG10_big_fil_rev_8_21_14_0_10_36_11]|nr:MAG: hypothetical protein COV17_01645 [Candidatus Woesearchaeota archaeon CG10_big_fil_rev_8_21_14_0_10_36_11]